jgi:uncharacterized protein YdaU (DUF1376 family)
MYWGDYLANTQHLSPLQHGFYCLLIAHYWVHGGLPDNDDQLARIVRVRTDEWLYHKPVLQEFFHSGWRHNRVEVELKRSDAKLAQRKAAGSKGGTVTAMRWQSRVPRKIK